MSEPVFDLVTSVWNSLYHIRACAKGVLRNSTLPYHFYVVNDGSTPRNTRELHRIMADFPAGTFTIIENERNLGYLESVNRGLSAGRAPLTVLVNSDTIPQAGYLEKLKAAFDSDPSIGVINPVSNWANWTRVCQDIPEGLNIASFAEEIDRLSNHRIEDIFNASGFFFCVRRKVYDEIGLFDPVYGFGYYEETDFCFRALDAGYRVVVDDSMYVYHHGWGSFPGPGRSTEIFQRNRDIFLSRFGERYKEREAWFKKSDPVAYLRKRIDPKGPKLADIDNLGPHLWKERQARLHGAKATRKREESLESIQQQLDEMLNLEQPLREEILPGADDPQRRAEGRRIIYVLPGVTLHGGNISVLQLVNQLVLRGFDANVATYGPVDEEVRRLFPTFFNPFRFPDKATLIKELPDCDIAVATQWETAYAVNLLARLRGDMKTAYFVQDYEPNFYKEHDMPRSRRAERSYHLIRHQIVKTRWLKRLLRPYGGTVHRIPLGINLDFYQDANEERRLQVLSLARPSSRHRNYEMVKRVYEELHRRRPDLGLALFGTGYATGDLAFPVVDYGKLTNFRDVAKAMNESTLLLDCSTFQGFGRPGLEAMACGTAAVLTREGGITQYAKHEYNCLLIDPCDLDDIVGKILELLDDSEKRTRLVQNGLETAQEYSLEVEGERTATLFGGLLEGNDMAALEPESALC